jgi:hypothetical protein
MLGKPGNSPEVFYDGRGHSLPPRPPGADTSFLVRPRPVLHAPPPQVTILAVKSIVGLCGVLAVILHAAPVRADTTSWTGTVSLQIRFEETHRSDSGSGGDVTCSGVESVRRNYRATAKLYGGTDALAEIAGDAEIEISQTCSGRQQCEGETIGAIGPVRAYSRVTREVIRCSGGGEGMAVVGVEVGADGRYTVRVDVPPMEGGTSSMESTDRTTGGCYPSEPQHSSVTDPNWTLDGESASGSGRVDSSDPDHLTGEARIDEWTTLRWDLRRTPPDCDGLARDLEGWRQRQRQDRERVEALAQQLRNAIGPATAALAGAEASGLLPVGMGAAAASLASQAIALLPASGGGDPSSAGQAFDNWATGGDALGAQALLQAAQAVAPTGQVAQLLDLFQQAIQQLGQSQASQSIIDALEEALRQCRE